MSEIKSTKRRVGGAPRSRTNSTSRRGGNVRSGSGGGNRSGGRCGDSRGDSHGDSRGGEYRDNRSDRDRRRERPSEPEEPSVPKGEGPELKLFELQAQAMPVIMKMAESMGLEDVAGLRRHELIFEILKANGRIGGTIFGRGVLETLPDGFGFLRSPEYKTNST